MFAVQPSGFQLKVLGSGRRRFRVRCLGLTNLCQGPGVPSFCPGNGFRIWIKSFESRLCQLRFRSSGCSSGFAVFPLSFIDFEFDPCFVFAHERTVR